MSLLASWLQRNAKPAPEDHWTSRLWQSAWNAQENVFSLYQVREEPELEQQQGPSQGDHDKEEDEDEDEYQDDDDREPSKCVVMQGVEGEFNGHDIAAVLMRSEYLNLMKALIDFVKGIPPPQNEGLENWAYTYLKDVPANPFASYRVKKDRAIILISGSPGSGKSLFLHPLLGLRLNARLPTAFQVGDYGPTYLFTELGCHVVHSMAQMHEGNDLAPHVPGIWCLTESDSPPLLYESNLGTVVQVTPAPRTTSFSWLGLSRLMSTHSGVPFPPVKLFTMPTFSYREATLVRDLRTSGPKPTDKQLETWLWTFTPNLRVAFANAHDQENYKVRLMEKVPFDTERGMVDVIRRMNKFEDIGDPDNEFFCWEVKEQDYKGEGNFVSKIMPQFMVEYLGATTPDAQMALYARLFKELY